MSDPTGRRPQLRIDPLTVPGDPVFDEHNTARYLGVSCHTLRDWRSRRCQYGPRYIKLGPSRSSRIGYRRSDLDAWVAARARATV